MSSVVSSSSSSLVLASTITCSFPEKQWLVKCQFPSLLLVSWNLNVLSMVLTCFISILFLLHLATWLYQKTYNYKLPNCWPLHSEFHGYVSPMWNVKCLWHESCDKYISSIIFSCRRIPCLAQFLCLKCQCNNIVTTEIIASIMCQQKLWLILIILVRSGLVKGPI